LTISDRDALEGIGSLMLFIGVDRTKAEELQKLIKLTAERELVKQFDDDISSTDHI
jgi:hypothetical protein